MAIDNIGVWRSTFNALPKVLNKSWAAAFATWVDDRVTGKAQLTGITTATPPFTFSKSTFQAQLEALKVTSISAIGGNNFGTAWEAAINASLTLTVVAGDFTAPGDATTWSSVTLAEIDAPSVLAAKAALIAALTNSNKCNNTANSDFPKSFRDAFLMLTGSVTGMNSLPIPTPFDVLLVPLM